MDEVKAENDLRERLKSQLEYYFSPRNLQNDPFLRSQMNHENYVPIEIVANFKMIKSLTDNKSLIVSVMRESKQLQVNDAGTHVKSTTKKARTTLILRDIPPDTPQADIRALFDNETCGKPSEIRSDIQNMWFVSFENEDDAQNSCLYLRGKTFEGKPIKCGMKSENVQRGYYNPSSSHSVNGMPNFPNFYPGANGFFPRGGPYTTPHYMPPGTYQDFPNQWQASTQSMPPGQGSGGPGGPHGGGPQQSGGPLPGRRSGGPHQKPHNRFNQHDNRRNPKHRQQSHPFNHNSQQFAYDNQNMKRKPTAMKRKSKKGEFRQRHDGHGSMNQNTQESVGAKQQAKYEKQQLSLGPEEFPALASSNAQSPSKNVSHNYQKREMARIIRSLASVTKPQTIRDNEKKYTEVIRDAPLAKCQLATPIPVMFPASPSPHLAARPHHSSDLRLDTFTLPDAHQLDVPRVAHNSMQSRSNKQHQHHNAAAGGSSSTPASTGNNHNTPIATFLSQSGPSVVATSVTGVTNQKAVANSIVTGGQTHQSPNKPTRANKSPHQNKRQQHQQQQQHDAASSTSRAGGGKQTSSSPRVNHQDKTEKTQNAKRIDNDIPDLESREDASTNKDLPPLEKMPKQNVTGASPVNKKDGTQRKKKEPHKKDFRKKNETAKVTTPTKPATLSYAQMAKKASADVSPQAKG